MIKLSMVDWSELTQDILLVILGKLILGKEHYWFGCVCRSWRSAVVDFLNRCAPYGAPCLIVRDRSSKSRRLLGLPEEKNIIDGQECFPQIGVPSMDVCCGSHQGWLVMINKNMEMYLLNPFSNIRIDLPPLVIPRSKCKSSVCSSKVILSTTPTASSDCLVVFVYKSLGIDFCKVGDEAWRYIDESFFQHYTNQNRYSCIDAIYFEGQVWMVSFSGEIFVCDLTAPEPKITKYFPRPWQHWRTEFWHLVECRGEILRIFRKLETKPFNINESVPFGRGDEEDAHNNVLKRYDIKCRTGSLEVYKLDDTRVENLDGDAVFIGRNQSFSLSNPQIFGFQGNRIYFTDYGILYNDMGVFNLEDGTVESLYKTNSKFTVEPPLVWIVRKS